jgi:D-alanyl-D-alanine dipeptidase
MICKPFRSRALEPMYLGTMPTLSRARSAAATLLLLACGGRPAAVTSPEAPPLPTASDAAAESLLVDLGSVDSTIQLDVRYATRNNFTGEPLPGYEAPRVLLRREVSAALARVQAMESEGFQNYEKEWWHFSYPVDGAVAFDRVIR